MHEERRRADDRDDEPIEAVPPEGLRRFPGAAGVVGFGDTRPGLVGAGGHRFHWRMIAYRGLPKTRARWACRPVPVGSARAVTIPHARPHVRRRDETTGA